MYRKLIGALLGLAMMGMAGSANAVLIDIDFEAFSDGVGLTDPITEDGFTGTTTLGFYEIFTNIAAGSTDTELRFSGSAAATIRFTNDAGNAFDLISLFISDASDTATIITSAGGVAPMNASNPDLTGSLFDNLSFFDIVYTGPNDLAFKSITVDVTAVEVPEPSTLALFGIGLAGLGFMSRRRQVTGRRRVLDGLFRGPRRS